MRCALGSHQACCMIATAPGPPPLPSLPSPSRRLQTRWCPWCSCPRCCAYTSSGSTSITCGAPRQPRRCPFPCQAWTWHHTWSRVVCLTCCLWLGQAAVVAQHRPPLPSGPCPSLPQPPRLPELVLWHPPGASLRSLPPFTTWCPSCSTLGPCMVRAGQGLPGALNLPSSLVCGEGPHPNCRAQPPFCDRRCCAVFEGEFPCLSPAPLCSTVGATAGHYIAFGKNRLSKQWLEFDDSQVTPRTPARIERQEAYILFYQRRFRPPPMPMLMSVDEVSIADSCPSLRLGFHRVHFFSLPSLTSSLVAVLNAPSPPVMPTLGGIAAPILLRVPVLVGEARAHVCARPLQRSGRDV